MLAGLFSLVAYLYFFAYFCAYWAFLVPTSVLQASLFCTNKALMSVVCAFNMDWPSLLFLLAIGLDLLSLSLVYSVSNST